MSVVVIEAPTLGEGWLATSRAILETGALAAYDGQATRELALLTVAVRQTGRPATSGHPQSRSATRSGSRGCTRTSSCKGGVRARRSPERGYGPALQLRGPTPPVAGDVVREHRVGRRTGCGSTSAPGRSATTHDAAATLRHGVHPLREHARLLAARRSARAGGLRPQSRLRQEGLAKPCQTRTPTAEARQDRSSASPCRLTRPRARATPAPRMQRAAAWALCDGRGSSATSLLRTGGA